MADLGPPALELSPDALGISASVGLQGSPETIKPVPGMSAQLLTPQALAGLSLAKRVLRIAVGAIVALIAYLFVEDTLDGLRTDNIYRDVMRQASVGVEFSDPGAITGAIAVLEKGIATPSVVATDGDIGMERSLEEMLSRFDMLSPGQKGLLGRCLPFPTTADRADILRSCVDLLQIEEQAARASAANLDKLRIMVDVSKEVDARHQSLYSFWLQMAQLILLNLILPLLTGLFGYIFACSERSSPA